MDPFIVGAEKSAYDDLFSKIDSGVKMPEGFVLFRSGSRVGGIEFGSRRA